MSFKSTAILTAVITFILGIGYLAAGALLVARWNIEPTTSVLLLARRIGAAYLGLAIIFWLARSLAPSQGRSALCAGASATCALLALLGVYEYAAGHASAPILVSAALETFLAVSFVRILATDRRLAAQPSGEPV